MYVLISYVSSFHSTGRVFGMDLGPWRVCSRQGQSWWDPSPWCCRTGTGTLRPSAVHVSYQINRLHVVNSANSCFNRCRSLMIHAWSWNMRELEGGDMLLIRLTNSRNHCYAINILSFPHPHLPPPPPPPPPTHTHTHTQGDCSLHPHPTRCGCDDGGLWGTAATGPSPGQLPHPVCTAAI